MGKMNFSIDINAPKEKVSRGLWNDDSCRGCTDGFRDYFLKTWPVASVKVKELSE